MRKDFRFGGSGGQGVISLAVLLANAFGVQNNYEAVSYTHLDVYKRQRSRRTETMSPLSAAAGDTTSA